MKLNDFQSTRLLSSKQFFLEEPVYLQYFKKYGLFNNYCISQCGRKVKGHFLHVSWIIASENCQLNTKTITGKNS